MPSEEFYTEISSIIKGVSITAYQKASLLGMFIDDDIGDVGVEKWIHKNLDDIPDAALTLAGFDPVDAKLNGSLFSHKVLTSSERLRIGQKEMKQWEKIGMDQEGIALIAKKVGQQATYYLFRGESTAGVSPSGEGNYILAAGAGTLASPSITGQDNATVGGVWGTYANKVKALYSIVGAHLSAGHSLETTIAFYPKIAYANMHSKAANELNAVEILAAQGIPSAPLDKEYLYTEEGADPTNALFDLVLVDMLGIRIGYTMHETTTVIAPHHEIRNTLVETEVWFTPYMIPVPKDSAITKGVSRLQAIAQA